MADKRAEMLDALRADLDRHRDALIRLADR